MEGVLPGEKGTRTLDEPDGSEVTMMRCDFKRHCLGMFEQVRRVAGILQVCSIVPYSCFGHIIVSSELAQRCYGRC